MVKRSLPAWGLMVLSPLVAEFLLGNLPITMLPALLVLAPFYGGAAVLIRETARRRGLGWGRVLLLALAFAVVQEAFVTRSLFDPGYAGMALSGQAWIPALGISAWWAVFVLTIHAVWSVCVPIALAETLASAPAGRWLSPVVAGVLFVLGAAGSALTTATPYALSAPQIAGSAAVIAALVAAALIPLRPGGRRTGSPETAPDEGTGLPRSTPDEGRGRLTGSPRRSAPGGGVVFCASLGVTSAFWGLTMALDVLGAAVTVAGYLVLVSASLLVVRRWSRGGGWGPVQVFAPAAGAVLTYAWHSFVQPPAVPAPPAVDLLGNAIFTLAALVLLAAGWRRLRRERPARKGSSTCSRTTA
ncbi:hypothetical protein FH608_041555 [Nonomuraea phyllanthi]|uniref:Uncharacterized protein n=1 Tax=Nonomuraea phyllanthi TaxID=2219224 RepID=A0A5C4VH53_9ACTN|nr:hypothetical protein [Nonomuraea phyllanthi]KAB8188972.1 hypothetical protein FH608_041555 [Nonomuraea phyllanthi]QFY09537.1 hypothetical protein GBF35_25390 [Nonomuraea phyllanthi]